MSSPNPDRSNFKIHTDPPPPNSAAGLVESVGYKAARNALPEKDRKAFDDQFPTELSEAHRHQRADLQASEQLLQNYNQLLNQSIVTRGYTTEQSVALYLRNADVRRSMTDDVTGARERVLELESARRANLAAFINDQGLTSRATERTGRFSTPEQGSTAAAAAQVSPSYDQRNHNSTTSDRVPLGQSHGDRRQSPSRS